MSATRSTVAGSETAGKPTVLLWVAEPRVYENAVAEAGLASRVELHACKPTEDPAPDLLARCDAWIGKRTTAGAAFLVVVGEKPA